MKTKLLGLSLFALTTAVVYGYPKLHNPSLDPVAPQPVVQTPATAAAVATGKPKVEVLFVLDTTGSMAGLIQAAKENIWSIASTMARAQPAPELKIGLVAFRDRGDDYVTRVVDLSDDLDSMYARLMDFEANGGGDGPESVNQALHDAVHKVSWSQDKDAYKVIFLVGDAPPHMDYKDEVQYPATLKTAAARGIVVNTILAGDFDEARATWKQIAQLNQGRFFQVEQSGNAVAVATPFDEDIARLSRELDGTRLFYGDAEVRAEVAQKQAATDKVYGGSSAASLAKRGAYVASAPAPKGVLGEQELVEAVSSGRVALESVAETELPAEMKPLTKTERARLVERKSAERDELRAKVRELADKRQEFVKRKLAESKAEKKSLDYQIFETVKAQAAEKGLSYGAAPTY